MSDLSPPERHALRARIESMDPVDLNMLPVSIITLALDGTILRYNRTEAGRSQRRAADQIGRNFFREVAPCTEDPLFEGRFRELALPDGHGTMEFDYTFAFPWGSEQVLISFLRAPEAPRIQVVVTWPDKS